MYTVQTENVLSFHFPFFQSTCFKTAQNIYLRLLHTLSVYADFFLFVSFLFSQTENCTVNVDVHNFFVLKKKQKITVKSFDHSIVVLSKKKKKV